MHAPAWANADSTRLGGISQRSASSDLFSLLYYLIVRLRSRSRSSPSFPLQYFRSIFRVCTIALLISRHKCLQGGCAQAIQTKTNTNTAYSCTPPILWDLGDISQSPSRNGWAHGRLLRCRSKLDPHQANFDMFLGSGILDLSPLGYQLGITSISSIAAQSSLWLQLSVRIIISPVFDYCLHATIFCLLYQYYRHFIFSLAQAPWDDSTYSFELALNVWLTYSTRSRHRTSVSGDGSTATVVHERWLIMAHLNYFASN